MIVPILKFSEIKKNPNIMLGLDHAYICKYGSVEAHLVSNEYMQYLKDCEAQFHNMNADKLKDQIEGEK